jgi:hypothetical protein
LATQALTLELMTNLERECLSAVRNSEIIRAKYLGGFKLKKQLQKKTFFFFSFFFGGWCVCQNNKRNEPLGNSAVCSNMFFICDIITNDRNLDSNIETLGWLGFVEGDKGRLRCD